MCQFIACFSIECDNMTPVTRCCTEPFAHRIVADIAELFGIVRIVTQTGIPEILLKQDAIVRDQPVFPIRDYTR